MQADTMLPNLRSKLRFKAQFHLGAWCPDVEDIVQQTMLRLLRASQDGVERTPPTWAAFANATCNNVIHEYRRQLWRDKARNESTREPQSPSAFSALETCDLIENTLADLPVRDQEILRAFYLEEKTVDQICSITGISRAHFAVALFRAKARFRKQFGGTVKSAGSGNH